MFCSDKRIVCSAEFSLKSDKSTPSSLNLQAVQRRTQNSNTIVPAPLGIEPKYQPGTSEHINTLDNIDQTTTSCDICAQTFVFSKDLGLAQIFEPSATGCLGCYDTGKHFELKWLRSTTPPLTSSPQSHKLTLSQFGCPFIQSKCLRNQAGYLDLRVAYRHFSIDVWIQPETREWEHYVSGRRSIQDAVHLKSKTLTGRSRYSVQPLRREVVQSCYGTRACLHLTTCEKMKSESLRSVKPKMSSKSSKTWRTKDRGRGKPIELDDWLHIRARKSFRVPSFALSDPIAGIKLR